MSPATKPGKDTVYIDADDEITAIIDKVEGAKNKVVALVLPKRTSALKSIVNMRLLKRSAERASKNVVLITGEEALMPLAGAAGVHVSKSLNSKPEIPPSPLESKAGMEDKAEDGEDDKDSLDSKRSIGELAAEHEGAPIDLDDEDEEEKPKKSKQRLDKRLKVPNFERFRLGLAGIIVAAFLLIFLLIFGIFVWPKATITIQTESTPITSTFTLNTSDKAKALDETGGVIPSVLKSSDQTISSQIQATGQQNNGTKATGSATMRTADCSGKLPSAVASGTGISTNGLTYITQQSASFSPTVDGGGNCYYITNSVGITAQQGGTKYNTSLSGASVAGSSGITASGSASGGTDNITTVVSQSDVDGAKQKATAQLPNDFTTNFEKQLSDSGLYVISSSLKTGDPQVTASPSVGQPASTANITIKVTYSFLTLQKSDLSKAITDQLNKQIDTKKQKISSEDVTKGATISIQSSSSPTNATLQISDSTTAIPTLNLDSIKKQAGGLKSGDIRSFISNYPGVKNVKVDMSPFWVAKAPKKPSKIHIVLQQVKSN